MVCYHSRAGSRRHVRSARGGGEPSGTTSSGSSDDALAAQIRADRIDILFDLSGHTADHRLLVFARRPAPIQITWIGYVGTTGLKAMDYLIADRFHVPPGAEAHYREKVLRMPDGYVCFDPPAEAPAVGPLPALERGHVTFGSFNNVAKLTPRGDRALGRDRPPACPGRGCCSCRRPWVARPRASGSAPRSSRPAAIPIGSSSAAVCSWPELLAAYNTVDLALDPFPYSGGVTTCEALWMGVPVVTCPGETFASRHSLSHLSNVGLTETVAGDRSEYVDLAVRLASDLPHLASAPGGLRDRMARSPLCDGARFARRSPVASARRLAAMVPPMQRLASSLAPVWTSLDWTDVPIGQSVRRRWDWRSQSCRATPRRRLGRWTCHDRACALGRYRLIELLGRGGQGEVWRALQVEPIVEEVALKLLTAEHAEKPGLRLQFHREAMWGARLVSPWLLPTYEFGSEAGFLYLAQPLIDGDSLAALIACRRRSGSNGLSSPQRHWLLRLPRSTYVRAIVTIVARVARALAVAHAAHVVHRDIKPANILVDRVRPSGVYLCDFGLGRDLADPAPALLCDTPAHPLHGSRTSAGALSRRDPLRRLRTGRHPVGGRHAGSSVLVFRRSAPGRRPKYLAYSTPRLPCEVAPWLPMALQSIIRRAMSRSPRKRYPSMTTLAEDLERSLRPCRTIRN